MKVLIVEDEKYQAEMLVGLLQKYDPSITVTKVANSVQDTISFLNSNQEPDLIFMDVELGEQLCFSIFNQAEIHCPVIFTTSHTTYSLDAFYHNGIHYLIKPITKARLEEGMQKFYMLKGEQKVQQSTAKDKIIIKTGNKNIPIQEKDITYIMIHDGYVYLHLKGQKKYLIDTHLDDLLKELNPQNFFRLNRQAIGSKAAIKEYSIYTRGRLKVAIEDMDEPAVVSFKRRSEFLKWFDS